MTHSKISLFRKHSDNYNFVADPLTGFSMRWGKTVRENPQRAPIPELIDISISNHCTNQCSFCYRESRPDSSFMSLSDYEFILNSIYDIQWGNVFQVALGGGEPLEHPNFLDFLKLSRRYNIIPNFTTNGLHINRAIVQDIKCLVGTAAISFPDILCIPSSNANIFIAGGIKTNIHFILDRESIIQGIEILEGLHNLILKGFNSIIFLTFKPTGRGSDNLCLEWNENLIKFCGLIDNNRCGIKVGFDSCFMPMLMHLTNTDTTFIEPCECAFFSAYIDEILNVKPCSFDNSNEFTYNLRETKFSDIWNNFWETYRNRQINTCKRTCKNTLNCRGGCPYYPQINLCKVS